MELAQYHAMAEVELEHWWFQSLQRAVDGVLERRRPGQRLRLLDAGCGTGGRLNALADRHWTFGVDLAPLALQYCRERGSGRLARSTLERLPFADQSFDVVLSTDVLQHVHDDAAALREMARVLRPGGLLVAQVAALPILASDHDRAVHSLRRYRRSDLSELARGAGFLPREAYYRQTFLAPLLLLRKAALFAMRIRPEEPAVRLPPSWLNALLSGCARIDAKWNRHAPWGSSLMLEAEREG